MAQIIKLLVMALTFGVILYSVLTLYTTDEVNVRQTQEVNTVLESSNVGSLRASFEDDYEGGYGIDVQTAVNELKLEISNQYVGMSSIKLDYVFFDEEDTTYTYDEALDRYDIVGIQFKVTTLDGDGEALSSSTEKRVLDKAVD